MVGPVRAPVNSVGTPALDRPAPGALSWGARLAPAWRAEVSMRDPETACARCGRVHPAEALRLWEERARFRVFNGPAAVTPGGERTVHSYVYRRFAHLVCSRCETRLLRGAGVDDIHNRRIALGVAAIFALAVAAFAVAPAVTPAFLAAFWRW